VTVSVLPLDDVRVVDLASGIASSYCTKMLADAGADVIKIERPGGDPLRAEGALFSFLHTSKRSVVLDPVQPDDRAVLERAVSGADIVVIGHPRELEAILGCGVEEVRTRVPTLGIVAISWFGASGPWSARAATEFTLQGWCGSIASRGRKQTPPLATGGRIGEWVAGAVAAVAALATLRDVRRTGTGGFADVSTLEAMTIAFNQFQAVAAQLDGRGPEPDANPRFVDVPSVEPSADGWVGFATNGTAQFRAFADLVGHPEWGDHPEFGRVDRRGEHDRELRAEIAKWTTRRSTDEVIELAGQRRIPVAPLGNGETLPAIAPFASGDTFVEHPDGGMLQPRIPYRMGDGAGRPFGPVAALGEHTAEVRAESGRRRVDEEPAASRGAERPAPGRPLAGIRVFDFTSYWAGPYAAQILGFLGADVIKVESVQRPDGTRMGTAYSSVGDRPWELAPLFHGANTNKRDVTLDFAQPDGLALARRLLESCDVLVENYTPRVVERFGLIDDDMRRANPGLVVLRMPPWGLDSEWRDRPAFAQTMEQVTGLAWVTGYPNDAPVVPRGPCDPLGGLHAAFALLVALERRDRTGVGETIEAPLVESALNVAAEQVAEFSRNGNLLVRTGNRGRFAAPQNVYPVGRERWIALAVETDQQWRALCEALGHPEWSRARTLDHAEGRRAAHDMIDDALIATFAESDLDALVEHLWAAGVPVAPVVNPRRVVENEQLAFRGFYEPVRHPLAGDVRIPGFPARWDVRNHAWHHRPPPMLGEHNAEVLGALGVEPAELERLTRDAVIGDRPVTN
jgi:crotonobetainyl-CoA:carnitine CoA-transferase CaiB-like acyl-CoA transferase